MSPLKAITVLATACVLLTAALGCGRSYNSVCSEIGNESSADVADCVEAANAIEDLCDEAGGPRQAQELQPALTDASSCREFTKRSLRDNGGVDGAGGEGDLESQIEDELRSQGSEGVEDVACQTGRVEDGDSTTCTVDFESDDSVTITVDRSGDRLNIDVPETPTPTGTSSTGSTNDGASGASAGSGNVGHVATRYAEDELGVHLADRAPNVVGSEVDPAWSLVSDFSADSEPWAVWVREGNIVDGFAGENIGEAEPAGTPCDIDGAFSESSC